MLLIVPASQNLLFTHPSGKRERGREGERERETGGREGGRERGRGRKREREFLLFAFPVHGRLYHLLYLIVTPGSFVSKCR